MARVPYRRGVPTILRLLRIICRILLEFRPVVIKYLTPEQMVFWDGLMTACELFQENIPDYAPGTVIG